MSSSEISVGRGSNVSSQKAKKALSLAVRVAVSVGLCVYIGTRVDWSAFREALRSVNGLLLGVAFLVLLPSPTVSALKWGQLLELHGVRYPFRYLHRAYWMALFFNNFLPSSIGGDGYRLHKTLDNGVTRAGAVSAILMERVAGLAVLALLGYLAAMVIVAEKADTLLSTILIVCSTGGVLAVACVAVWKKGLGQRVVGWSCFPGKMVTLLARINDYWRDARGFGKFLAVTLCFHFEQFFCFWLTLKAFGAELSLAPVAVIVMLTSIAGILPISINGIGLIDGTFVYLAQHFGVETAVAVSVMLSIRVFVAASCLPGAFFFFRGEKDKRMPSGVLHESSGSSGTAA